MFRHEPPLKNSAESKTLHSLSHATCMASLEENKWGNHSKGIYIYIITLDFVFPCFGRLLEHYLVEHMLLIACSMKFSAYF